MANTVKIRRSGTTTSTPSSLDHGELAINYADDTLFWKDAANVIQSFVFQAYASATHKSSHATGGSDALTPADIGAAPAASPTFTGTVTNSGLVRWEYPDKQLDASVSGLGYLRVYDETGFAAGLGVSTASFNIGTQGGINLRFVTNGSERAIINTSGNFGIGNPTPASRLDVNGVITVSATAGSAGSYLPSLCFASDANTGLGQVGGADTVSLITAGSERVRVDASGRVGIGVTPTSSIAGQSALDVNGPLVARGRVSTSQTSAAVLEINGNVIQLRAYGTTAGSGILDLRSGGGGGSADTLAVRINSSQQVGIGTGTGAITALLDINADTLRLRTARTPASASAAGNAGDICWDASYLYICTATNTWRRIAHDTW